MQILWSFQGASRWTATRTLPCNGLGACRSPIHPNVLGNDQRSLDVVPTAWHASQTKRQKMYDWGGGGGAPLIGLPPQQLHSHHAAACDWSVLHTRVCIDIAAHPYCTSVSFSSALMVWHIRTAHLHLYWWCASTVLVICLIRITHPRPYWQCASSVLHTLNRTAHSLYRVFVVWPYWWRLQLMATTMHYCITGQMMFVPNI